MFELTANKETKPCFFCRFSSFFAISFILGSQGGRDYPTVQGKHMKYVYRSLFNFPFMQILK